MTDGKVVVGVDIGTSKIVTIIAKIDEEINVLGVAETRAQGIKKGQIVDIEEAVDAINSSIEASERMAGYSVSHVVASIGGGHIESQNSHGVVAVSKPDGEIIASDVERVVDAARAISLPSTREIIHVLPRNYSVDGQDGIKDPIGMSGVRLEVDTHIVTSSSTALRNLEKALSQVGVDVDSIVFSGYASSLAVVTDTEKELGVVLVDIGAGTTDLSIYVDGAIAYSSVLPIGARHITNDLAIGLRLSLESAEKIKLYLSEPQRKITLPEDAEETTLGRTVKRADLGSMSDEVDLGVLQLPEELHKVSRKTLVDGIIRPRLNEIFTMIGLEIKKSGYGGQTPAGLVITGGGSLTVGITESAKRMLAMPVRVGMPTGLKGLIDEINSPAFSTCVGLLVYGAKQDTGGGKSLPLGFSMPHFKGLPGGKGIKKLVDILKSFIP